MTGRREGRFVESKSLLQPKEILADVFLRAFSSQRLRVAVMFFPRDCRAFSELTMPLKKGSRRGQRSRRSLEI